MKSIATLALGLAIAGTATLTFAQATPPAAGKPAPGQARIDANGDGVIDRSEAARAPKFAEQFDKLDANKDGRITAEERPQHGMRDGKGGGQGAGQGGRDGMRGGRMQALDTNKDGRFSRTELAGRDRMLKNFGAIDANSDGMLSREEMQAYQKAHHGERGAQRPKN